jgi:hypothetical protein
MRVFRLQGFELAQGRHVARLRLCPDDEPMLGPLRRSTLWARAEESRSEIASALALPANRRALTALAGVPDDSRVAWTVREIGSSGAMDLVALVRRSSGGEILLFVDCLGARTSPARLREQVAQAVRNALSTLAKVDVGDQQPETRLIILSGWRRGVRVPTEARPLPALQREPAVLERIPEPQAWGHVAFVRESRPAEIYVALGPWAEFDREPFVSLPPEAIDVSWPRWEPIAVGGFGEGALVELEQHQGCVRVSLRLKSSAHKASLKQDRHNSQAARRVRALRAACYAGHLHVGAGRFVGETIEGGVPRLHWAWVEGQSTSAEAARDVVVAALGEFCQRAAAAAVPAARPSEAGLGPPRAGG